MAGKKTTEFFYHSGLLAVICQLYGKDDDDDNDEDNDNITEDESEDDDESDV